MIFEGARKAHRKNSEAILGVPKKLARAAHLGLQRAGEAEPKVGPEPRKVWLLFGASSIWLWRIQKPEITTMAQALASGNMVAKTCGINPSCLILGHSQLVQNMRVGQN